MIALDLLFWVLATCGVMMVWFHGSLFATCRARLEVSDSWVVELLACPLCMSFWIAATLFILWQVPMYWLPADSWLSRWVIYIPGAAISGWQLYHKLRE